MARADSTFLPLTISTAATLARDPSADPAVRAVHGCACRADAAAAECWAALLAGCDAPGRRLLPTRLRELALSTSAYAGGLAPGDRGRVERAAGRIVEAVADRDGAEFAEAFVGYDQAVATALVRVYSQSRRATR
ncbi:MULTISPECIES: sugar ABC transporter substrate-binding protein [Actinokineospora]|uniref:sugar ABC transporter substrate-binding protein n=1 Tax=Actinokineospora TaxID=39845 RepID=UPI001670B758|nr:MULTISPECIES: sugar ABC transporter substrate-binding protein [Actinokineospora]